METKPSAVSTLLDERALADFPSNGRRFGDLALFSPGETQDPRGLDSSSNGDLSFGGIRGFQNSFLVDGSDYNNAFFAQARGRYRAPYEFSTKTVQEFRVSSNSYGAEQGRSGGAVVNVVTKSGSNHMHGTALYHLRDSSFGAADPFLAFKPHNRQQQVGGTIGGPLKHNKIYNSIIQTENGITDSEIFLTNTDYYDHQIFPSYPNPLVGCPLYAANCALPAGFTQGVTNPVSAFASNFVTPRVQQSSITLEKEVASHKTVSLSLMNVHGEHLIRALDVNLSQPTALTYPIFDSTGSIFQGGYYTVDSFATWQFTRSLTCPWPPSHKPL